MKTTEFQLVSNPDIGFSIVEEEEKVFSQKIMKFKRTGKNVFSIWIDEYEGGEAPLSDWELLDTEKFYLYQDAYDYIINKYGIIAKI